MLFQIISKYKFQRHEGATVNQQHVPQLVIFCHCCSLKGFRQSTVSTLNHDTTQHNRMQKDNCVCLCVFVCVCVCVYVCVCICHHKFEWLGVFLCILIQYLGFMSFFVFVFFMFSWMFQHDYLDTCCFECLICMCFIFLYLPLFSAIEHVSHGKAL